MSFGAGLDRAAAGERRHPVREYCEGAAGPQHLRYARDQDFGSEEVRRCCADGYVGLAVQFLGAVCDAVASWYSSVTSTFCRWAHSSREERACESFVAIGFDTWMVLKSGVKRLVAMPELTPTSTSWSHAAFECWLR